MELNELIRKFESGDVPTGEDFEDLIKNCYNNTEDSVNSGEIVAWGDSLTGWGGLEDSYIGEVGRLSGRVVHNMGIGGEPSNVIASRQGGLSMLCKDFTIPASSTQSVEVASLSNPLFDDTGKTVITLRQGYANFNPCYIKGVKGNLTVSQTSVSSSDYKLNFQREVSGDAVVIDRPTQIISESSLQRRNDIMVIFIGQNDGFDNDSDELVSQIKSMIDFNSSIKKEYIVLGLTSGTAELRSSLEKKMHQSFGRRYINLRKYLSEYGLSDLGMEPTSEDLEYMINGRVPPSLLIDTVHHTDEVRLLIGELVYKKMVELGMI